MKQSVIFFFVSLFLLTPCYAMPNLWHIQQKNSSIYLFGSIHVGNPSMYPLSQQIETAFFESDKLVVEADISGSGALAAISWLLLNGVNPLHKTLDDLLTTKTLALLKKTLKQHKLSYDTVKTLKPWIIAMQLTGLSFMMEDSRPELGVDIHFLLKAHQQHKSILELESIAEQFALFENFDLKTQEQFLFGTLQDLQSDEHQLNQMISYWKSGDSRGLSKIVLDEFEKNKQETNEVEKVLYNSLFLNRNKKMAQKIDELLHAGGRYFVVVGAAHFLGKESILHFLEQKGIQIEQVEEINLNHNNTGN
ncbi:MAG: hypothetical protein COW84_02265 [Gammaproteobacteria bacterium CG22_combo_CG10-13_8_21_14_all_40_8]|nr:MAG: hypothetical protein COW84_02265 [Gammaproteobacteria bacterium CG22_combo_CG10-13_8_21_14_all_40_8]